MLTPVKATHIDDLPEYYRIIIRENNFEDSDDSLDIMVGFEKGKHYSIVTRYHPSVFKMFILVILNESTHNIYIRTNAQTNEPFVIPGVFYPFKILEDGTKIVNENDEGHVYLSYILDFFLSDRNNSNQDNAIDTFNAFAEIMKICP